LSYLDPPPMPAPVVVMKDVGGFVNEYQNQTNLYRVMDREVRLHECRSACTLALSLPNVCVYSDSTLKFHQAYDPRNHQSNLDVSEQLFESYPPAVRTRLGTLTRDYKVLRGSELIALGVRDCNEPRVMVASNAPSKTPFKTPPSAVQAELHPAEQGSLLNGLLRNMASVFGGFGARTDPSRIAIARAIPAKPSSSELFAEAPLPPLRPAELTAANDVPVQENRTATGPQSGEGEREVPSQAAIRGETEASAAAAMQAPETEIAYAPLPPHRPASVGFSYNHNQVRLALPKVITGAQPILAPGFSAYAELDR
jgi:hypothetical protein